MEYFHLLCCFLTKLFLFVEYQLLYWNVPQNKTEYRFIYFESCVPSTLTRTEEECELSDYGPTTSSLLYNPRLDSKVGGAQPSYPLPILDPLCFSSMNQWRSLLERTKKRNVIPIIYTPMYQILWELRTEYPNPYWRELWTKWLLCLFWGSLKSYPLPILDTLCFSSMNQWRSMLERITKQNGIPIIYTPSPHTYLILWKLCTEYPNPYQRELQTKWLWSLNLVSSLQS
jgi:hypothetical protein